MVVLIEGEEGKFHSGIDGSGLKCWVGVVV